MVIIKSPREVELIRDAGHVVACVFEAVKASLKPGMSTYDIDQIALKVIKDHGAIPTFKNYGGFSGNVCVSVNDTLIHGIANKKEIIKEGDIVSVDVGATLKGYVADACRTFIVGETDPATKKLVEVTEESFWYAVDQFARPGEHLSNISHAIGEYASKHGYTLTRDYTGHGVGRQLHEDPQIPNVDTPNHGPILRPGMVLAIEPMVNQGSPQLIVLKDGWTVKTKDGKLCSHYENTIVITESGYEVLTKLKDGDH
ncbi:MAG TPA: type I methionyl aminopeptidase [Bacilli bacterium]|nr:type I methionyl aminopeptidase [Bacilli bacterium]